jgi:hypothetical protein
MTDQRTPGQSIAALVAAYRSGGVTLVAHGIAGRLSLERGASDARFVRGRLRQ